MSAKAAGMNADRKIIELVDIIIEQRAAIEIKDSVIDSMQNEIVALRKEIERLSNEKEESR